jgi:molybdopterin-guanine dinucleotide biosynthesis protein A
MGKPLLAHVTDALAPQTAGLVLCGRSWNDLPGLPDHPAPGLGPVGGLCAALQHGRSHGFDAILLAPCDLLGIPPDTAARLAPAPAVAQDQWLLGLWPVGLFEEIEAVALTEGAVSIRRLAGLLGARHVPLPGLRNINRPADLG